MTAYETAAPAALLPAREAYADLEYELAATRRMLERVPEGRGDWRPHERSMSLARLASHIAESPGYVLLVLGTDGYDVARGTLQPVTLWSTADLLELFDRNAAAMRAALETADDEALAETWTLHDGEQLLLQLPRGELVRRWGISHLVHHRAQLGVYLRLLEVPIPGVYGPSADEEQG